MNSTFTPALEVENLFYELSSQSTDPLSGNRQKSLSSISFSVDSGECLALIGQSGIGKSTLLRIIAGFHRPEPSDKSEAIQLRINGRCAVDSNGNSVLSPADRNIGICFQNGQGLQQDRTVQDNLKFPLERGTSKAQMEVKDLVDPFQLREAGSQEDSQPGEDFLEVQVKKLSGGQQQRVALARCFAIPDRALYLLDEPFEGQDNPVRQDLVRKVKERIKEEKEKAESGEQAAGFLIVTHNQKEAFSIADKVAFLYGHEEGCVQMIDKKDPEEIYKSPPHINVAEFMGDPVMNTVKVSDLKEKNNCNIARSCSLKKQLKNNMRLGIRPEDANIIDKEDFIKACITIEGKISATKFRGEDIVLEIELEDVISNKGGVIEVQFPSTKRYEKIVTGDKIKVGWSDEHVNLFEQNGASIS